MSNENRKSGAFQLNYGAKSAKVFYEAYPDRVIIDDFAWVGGKCRPLDRVLLNMNLTLSHAEEIIAESVGY